MTTQKNGLPEFVPVVVVGAGPAGIAAATLLGQYGVESLVLDRHETVYPLPRAVHADDEVFRILARLGVGDEFAAHSRPGHGLRLIDPQMRVLSEIPRSTEISAAHGFPQMNMFDQPELEAMLRANVKRYPKVTVHGNVEVTSVTQNQHGRVRVSFLDRVRGGEQSVQASYVLGCDGANSLTRASIGAHMYGLPFTQDWLVIDVNTDVDLSQWEGCDQLCNPERGGTYMRVSEKPATAGNSSWSTGKPCQLQNHGGHRVAGQALAGRYPRRRVGAGTGDLVHVPRAGGQPLA